MTNAMSVRAKSRLRDTMFHTDVILNFRQVFDTEKNVCEMCSLKNCAYSYISSTMCNFENCFLLRIIKVSRLRYT